MNHRAFNGASTGAHAWVASNEGFGKVVLPP